jgi:serine/threonine-protein kinase
MGAQGWVTGSGARVATSPPGRRKRTIIALLAAVLAIGVGAWAILGLPHTGRSEAQTQPGPIAGATSNHGKATATNPGRKASTRPPKTAAPTEAPTSPAPTTSDDSQAAGTPRDVCGSAFRVIDSAPLRSDGTLLGRVYLLRDDDTGRTCATTFKTADQGEPTTVSVYLKLGDDPGADDDSQDEDYAGPVTVQSDGTCVLWGGAVNDVSFDSPSDRCE